jgi:hypothetical protein
MARQLISDYGTVVMVVAFTALSYAPFLSVPSLPRLTVPSSFATTTGRSWWMNLTAISTAHVFSALLPALILTALIFFDHNVSSLISQDAEFKLKKPSAFNWDFMMLGCMTVLCGIIGVPPPNGLIPQAPLHVYSLAFIAPRNVVSALNAVSDAALSPPSTSNKVVFSGVLEQRLSNLLQSLLTAATLAALSVLALIPKAVLAGIFLFMGYTSFPSNTLAQRCWLFFADRKREDAAAWNAVGSRISRRSVHWFTFIQLLCFGFILGVTYTPGAIAFPLLICLLVPLRLMLLPKLFSRRLLYVAIDIRIQSLRLFEFESPLDRLIHLSFFPS